ncbi:MAG: glycosyltransferase family protein [Planctomycetes bacterium]|nr:glycosyltransferase family protein [Planctomycetota bacterium]
MSTTAVVIQARMGSSRLPGKVLMPLAGVPMVLHVIARAMRAPGVDRVILATTTLPGDDALARCVAADGRAAVVRGPVDDVLARYHQAAQAAECDSVVRVTADCPLLSPQVLGLVVADFQAHRADCDYASNTRERSWPRGLDVEVFSRAALETAQREADSTYDREHVTPFFYRQPERFRLRSVRQERDLSALRWTVDTPEDLRFAALIYDELYARDPHFDCAAVLAALDRHPDWAAINGHVAQKTT